MTNIDKRLEKLEAMALKTATVEVTYKDPDRDAAEMDLLDAVRLFAQGKIYTIKAILTPYEEKQRMNATIQEIEDYINAVVS